MNIIIQREPSNSKNTHGELMHNGDTLCYTLEDVVREVPSVPVAEWKVKGATAIPAGRYRVTLELSTRFGPDTLTINDVDGFDKIRMHGGNTETDTEGCPLLGYVRTESGIRNCAPAVSLVKELVRDALNQGEEVWIEVINGELES
ncbi:hypothetical protein UFOVP275_11 [uncultured Caudovirales phage]|uniref:DUF5675 domain-containing protein n=1 Tax=uncultured Caudovirales phage TaxID=2100421 RepID=A0A6J5LP42_9CAUD|nr:hypothetical protein UFOVP275_11 [uncultured Caudovirales phage]